MAQKLKRILLAGLLILIPIIVDVILKNRGVTLGAIPTVILYGPFLAFAGKVFHGEIAKKKAEPNCTAESFEDLRDRTSTAEDSAKHEFEMAQKIVDFGPRHPAVKEIAKMKGIKPVDVIHQYEEVIQNYNLKHRH